MFGATLCKKHRRRAVEGFTLIEVLVTLALVTVSLISIGALVGVNVRSTRSIKEHTALVSIARAVENGLPDSLVNLIGPLTGEIDSYRWRVDFRPFPGTQAIKNGSSIWIPETALITIVAPSGARFRLETARLLRSATQ